MKCIATHAREGEGARAGALANPLLDDILSGMATLSI